MSKELYFAELNNAIVEVTSDVAIDLDDTSLALIGGGEFVVVA
jgi:hypothetical protein